MAPIAIPPILSAASASRYPPSGRRSGRALETAKSVSSRASSAGPSQAGGSVWKTTRAMITPAMPAGRIASHATAMLARECPATRRILRQANAWSQDQDECEGDQDPGGDPAGVEAQGRRDAGALSLLRPLLHPSRDDREPRHRAEAA